MSCIAQWKTGRRCEAVLTDGSERWCSYHAGKLRKYHQSYKRLEHRLHHLDNKDDNFSGYTKEQLEEVSRLLMKIYHYRTTLRGHVYPDYHDDGHTARIDWIVEKLKVINNLIMSDIPPLLADAKLEDDGIPVRKARPTSVKQKKMGSTSTPQGSSTPNKAQMIVECSENIYNLMTVNAVNRLFGSIYHYFVDKFGNDGPMILYTSLTCANAIQKAVYKMSDYTHTIISKSKREGLYIPPDNASFICSMSDYIKYQESLKYGGDRRITLLYAVLTVVHSFRIDLGEHLKNSSFITNFSYNDKGAIDKLSNTLNNYTEIRSDDFQERAKSRLWQITHWYKGLERDMPQLDIGFCMVVAKVHNLTHWKLMHIGDGKYFFWSPYIRSATIDLINVRRIDEFFFTPHINSDMYKKIICKEGKFDFILWDTIVHLMLFASPWLMALPL